MTVFSSSTGVIMCSTGDHLWLVTYLRCITLREFIQLRRRFAMDYKVEPLPWLSSKVNHKAVVGQQTKTDKHFQSPMATLQDSTQEDLHMLCLISICISICWSIYVSIIIYDMFYDTKKCVGSEGDSCLKYWASFMNLSVITW